MQHCTTGEFVGLPGVILRIKKEDGGCLLEIPGHRHMVGVLDEMLLVGLGGGQEVGSS